MADYQLEGPKPARMYEVILPKKLGYFGKVQEVLEDLFNEQAIRTIPFVQQSIARQRQQDADVRRGGLDQDALPGLARLLDLRDGRPLSLAAGPGRRAGAGHPVHLPQPRRGPADSRTDFLAASLEVVNHLVAHRFADELGVEEEIWFLEYHSAAAGDLAKGAGRLESTAMARCPQLDVLTRRADERRLEAWTEPTEQGTTVVAIGARGVIPALRGRGR